MKKIVLITLIIMVMVIDLIQFTVAAFEPTGWMWPALIAKTATGMYTGNLPGHPGLDIGGGGTIIASKKGKVVTVRNNDCIHNYGKKINAEDYEICCTAEGNFIVIEHIENGKTFYSYYGHLAPNSCLVEEKQEVERGQPIAEMGSTGKSSGIHLHFTLFDTKKTEIA